MNKFVYVGLISLMIPFSTMAETTEETAPAPAATDAAAAVKGPRIACDEPNFDFGSVDSQNTIDHTFLIKNVGDTTLEISSVKPACGCTIAELTEKVVPPGGVSHVTAKLSLNGRSGLQSKSITIFSNDPETPEYHVSINGTVVQSIQIAPERLMFGQLGPGQEMEQAIDLNTASADSFNITEVQPSSSDLTATSSVVEEGKKYRLTVKLKGPAQTGPFSGNIHVTTDNANRPVIDIPVIANIVGEIIYAPSELAIPAQTDGTPLTRYIVLRPGTLAKFEMKNVVVPEGMLASTFPFGDQGYRIQIENIIPSADLDGKVIKIETSAEYMPEISIPIRIAQ